MMHQRAQQDPSHHTRTAGWGCQGPSDRDQGLGNPLSREHPPRLPSGLVNVWDRASLTASLVPSVRGHDVPFGPCAQGRSLVAIPWLALSPCTLAPLTDTLEPWNP